MRVTTTFQQGLLLAGLVSLTACSGLPVQQHYAEQIESAVSIKHAGQQTSGDLLALVTLPAMTSLVEAALRNNPSLQQTALTLEASRQQLRITRANQLPELSAGFSASRSEASDNQFSSSLTVGWTLDVWQQLADSSRAAALDSQQQQQLYRQARDLLAAAVMQGRISQIAAHQQVAVIGRQLVILERIQHFTEDRYRLGLESLENLETARSNVASSRASLVAAERSETEAVSALRLLLGAAEGAVLPDADALPLQLPALATIPELTPWRRPDLQAAYLAVTAADARASASYKQLLPNINLQAALQDVASRPAEALLTDPVWSLLGQLTAPLYQGGALKANAKTAEINAAKAYQTYRETLLAATAEIRLALTGEQSFQTQLEHVNEALAQAESSVSRYQQNYREGLVGLLDLLAVEQQRYALETQRNSLLQQQLNNRIELGLALGMGVQI